jgi:polyisoprenoid-binding protein YceI
VQEGDVYYSNAGTVRFASQAPLETIKAESKKLSGVLDVAKRTYAFTVLIQTFEGFNSPLQKEHFNENYMESDKIPSASFKGKIIEEVDLKTPGTYTVRAKGMMKIHGVEKEMIVKAKLNVKAGSITVDSGFSVPLRDFNINVPNIVNQKIASEILVDVKMDMIPKK